MRLIDSLPAPTFARFWKFLDSHQTQILNTSFSCLPANSVDEQSTTLVVFASEPEPADDSGCWRCLAVDTSSMPPYVALVRLQGGTFGAGLLSDSVDSFLDDIERGKLDI